MAGIRLRHLIFTGTDVDPAELKFDDGLNIVWGASNTGKSFASKAILFALGAATVLPQNDEIAAYNAVWLGITLGDEGDFTLYRATRGGHLKIHPGLISSAPPGKGEVLLGKHDQKRVDTVSHRLLEAIGLADRWVARDGNGKKVSLSIRLLAPYAVVGESDIMSEDSPVYSSGSPQERTFEQNLFRLLLTGDDDSATMTVTSENIRKAAKAAKIELVDELLRQLDDELNSQPASQLQSSLDLQQHTIMADRLLPGLLEIQASLDSLVKGRRELLDRTSEWRERATELEVTLERYRSLQSVYASDLERLVSIEEGGYLLMAMAGRDCPVCGASPDAQRHNHAANEISTTHAAATAESRKIEREQRELDQVIASLGAEARSLRTLLTNVDPELERIDDAIRRLRPQEASFRETYERHNTLRNQAVRVLEAYQRRDSLEARRRQIDATSTKRTSTPAAVGPDPKTLFGFGETVKEVLTAWHFPDADKVQFDGGTNDITIAGKARAANGKGVRAVLHAAFNVALVIHCIKNELPHPGFLVLDTPLLTYREPLKSRHGNLAQDEAALKATPLAEYFYRHLASLRDDVQVIVIENSDPPDAIQNLARAEVFTGQQDDGRLGLLARKRG